MTSSSSVNASLGGRHGPPSSPSSSSAALKYCTSLGFMSSRHTGSSSAYRLRAPARSPVAHRSQSRTLGAGSTTPTPVIHPAAPAQNPSSAQSSPPTITSTSGHRLTSSAILLASPEDSLRALTAGSARASSASCAGSRSDPLAVGLL